MISREGQKVDARGKVSRTAKWKPPHSRVTVDVEGVRQRVIE